MPEAALAVSVSHALARGAGALAAAGVDSPRLDAELLLGEVLGVDRAALVVASRASRWHTSSAAATSGG